MASILVTGGAGFIGSNLVAALLEEGHRVRVLDDLSTGDLRNLPPHPRLTFRRGDVRDGLPVRHATAGADVVFHLAASVGAPRSLADPVRDATVNILGTARVLEAALKAGVRRVVFSSSAAVYGEPAELPVTEGCPANPRTPYAATKWAAEKLCLAFGARHGLDVVALRYFNVYGANQRYDAYGNVIPIFAHRLLKGEPLTVYGDGEQTRDFVNVRDVVRANLLAAGSDAVGAFNVGSGKAVTIDELAALACEAFGRHVAVEHAPERSSDVRHSRASIAKARRTLGYRPAVGLRDGLAEYAAWAREELVECAS